MSKTVAGSRRPAKGAQNTEQPTGHPNKVFEAALAAEMRAKGVTQEALAAYLGVGKSFVGRCLLPYEDARLSGTQRELACQFVDTVKPVEAAMLEPLGYRAERIEVEPSPTILQGVLDASVEVNDVVRVYQERMRDGVLDADDRKALRREVREARAKLDALEAALSDDD